MNAENIERWRAAVALILTEQSSSPAGKDLPPFDKDPQFVSNAVREMLACVQVLVPKVQQLERRCKLLDDDRVRFWNRACTAESLAKAVMQSLNEAYQEVSQLEDGIENVVQLDFELTDLPPEIEIEDVRGATAAEVAMLFSGKLKELLGRPV